MLLEGEIAFAKNSPKDAFMHLSRQCTSVAGSFFGYAHRIMSDERLSVLDAWDRADRKYRAKMCINNDDMLILREFCARLGKNDVDNELKNIHNTMVKLNMQIAQAQNDCDKNRKIYQSGGILCGILIAVVLI